MKCKYCNSEIKENAKFCPYCGKEVVYGKRVGPNKSGRSSKTWLWILGVILLFVIVGGVWYSSGGVSGVKNRTFTVGDVSFKMIAVEGGTFTMGFFDEQRKSAFDWEKSALPAHTVTLNSFSIGVTEVSQELWQAVMGSNPSYFKGSRRPVEQVSWDDCQKFISKLNEITGENFRLPTEAEWEYAARGGNKGHGYEFAGSDEVGDVAWFWSISSRSNGTAENAIKMPNELGLYDMSGNVWEWCQDWYGSYSSNSQTNPTGPSSGSHHVIRGGSCYDPAGYSRVYIRDSKMRSHRNYNIGLRLAL